jgi:urease accessory protein
VVAEVRGGRHLIRTAAGLLRAQRLHSPPDRARVALVGQTALLLGGDRVELDVEVGPGAVLELSDIAATVAYHGRGQPTSWHTTIRLGPGARLSYAGEPLVVSDGADVTRSLTVELAEDSSARLREIVVLGRSGEDGGRLDASLVLRRSGEEFCREQLVLDPATRGRPGVLAGVRVVDSLLQLGRGAREGGSTPPDGGPETCRAYFSARADVVTYELLDEGSTLTRFLGTSPAESPLS